MLEVRHRVLGAEHPDTTVSAWDLFMSLWESQETSTAREVFGRHLAWLLKAEEQALSDVQQGIRDRLLDLPDFPHEM